MKMEILPTELIYLENKFKVNLPICPICGAVYIDEGLVTGRIAEVETLLESK
jgi:Zn-finger nucleic acid-binding protein